jgi:two-component sensor histidine kinase
MFKPFLLFTGLLSCIYSSLCGQQYLAPSPVVPQKLGVNQGLSQGMINCIYQDKEGYMWICTKDGLNRYDGYQIITYRHNPNDPFSLPDNYCNAVLEDDTGNFWIATNTKGLFVFEKSTESFYPVLAINSKNENLCIRGLEYNKGKLLLRCLTDVLLLDISQVNIKKSIATTAKVNLLFSYNKAQLNSKYKLIDGSTFQSNISCMPGNDIWVSFPDSLFHFTPAVDFSKWIVKSFSLASLGLEKKGNSMPIFFPMPDEPEMILIGYDKKIIHFDNKTRKIIFTKNIGSEGDTTIRNFFYTNDSNICRITSSLVFLYHPKTRETEVIAVKDLSLPERSVFQLYTDGQKMRWYESAGYGIAKVDPRKNFFKRFKGNQTDIYWNLPPEYMPGVPPLLRGLWGLALDKAATYWTYFPQSSVKNNNLYAYNTQTKTTKKLQGLPVGWLPVFIYNDYNDRLWVYCRDASNKNHIAIVDKTNGALSAIYPIPGSIESPEPFVSQFYFDDNGVMWLASINGLFAFNEKDKSWRHWKNEPKNKNSISANGVLCICPDPVAPEKYLWIGTEGAGFNRFEKLTGYCVRYEEKDGLPNNVAYCILSDSLHNLWISTNRGLSCFDPSAKTFRNFTEEDGLPGNEFNRYTSMRMQNGELMFGGVDGFVIFNPKDVLQKQSAAPLVFTGVSILNKAVNWKTDSSNLNAPIGYANTLTLQPGQNIFSISFATLEYRSNAKKMYKYKLEGFDKDWTSPGSRNEVTYTNLSPGTYTLKVMGTNTDGVWNEKPISMKIVVKPYWYQTLLFKLLILLGFVLALYALYKFRLKQVLKLEKLRNRIARDLHDEIGSTLSSISFYAESAKKVTVENEKAKNILSKINDSTGEMMEAMSDIVWAVNTGSDDFDDLANRLRSYAVQVTEAKNIDLHFTDNKDIPAIALDMEQRKNSYLICKEAINNAVKYANCTLLEVLISKEHRRLQIQIHDNGIGFEWENAQSTLAGNASGGNGLKNMKSRADEMGAGLEIRTKPGNGTNIVLSVSIKKS